MKMDKKLLNEIKLNVIDLTTESSIEEVTKAAKELSTKMLPVEDLRTFADDLAEYLRELELEEE